MVPGVAEWRRRRPRLLSHPARPAPGSRWPGSCRRLAVTGGGHTRRDATPLTSLHPSCRPTSRPIRPTGPPAGTGRPAVGDLRPRRPGRRPGGAPPGAAGAGLPVPADAARGGPHPAADRNGSRGGRGATGWSAPGVHPGRRGRRGRGGERTGRAGGRRPPSGGVGRARGVQRSPGRVPAPDTGTVRSGGRLRVDLRCPGGVTGRRRGLKPLGSHRSVWVRLPPRAPCHVARHVQGPNPQWFVELP